ncbi:MAG: hypothetical protein DWQ36_03495 [Acidobacteria bacterium]|nr:MAG: hypothetical protein DWQ30_13585 [Acidobacteriota bacterium]REK10683.1 MAG: hypothetical protein DWQ36_03495 [Acidobacteriota bacterium]
MAATEAAAGGGRIVVADPMHPAGLELLVAAGYEVVECPPRERLDASLEQAVALIVRTATPVDADRLAAAARLRVIGRAGVGIDHIDTEAAGRRGVVVVNTPDANTVSAAEHTVALLLATVRQLGARDAELKRGEWSRGTLRGLELSGRVLGIVGLGRIGSAVALRLRAFGMRVLANDPYIGAERFAAFGVEPVESLPEMVERSQVLTIHTPLDSGTRGLLSAQVLARLPVGAVVLNAARGGLVDESALLELLERGHVWGAGIDVFEQEGLASAAAEHFRHSVSARLAAHPRVVASPHVGAYTEQAQERMSVQVAEAVLAALASAPTVPARAPSS